MQSAMPTAASCRPGARHEAPRWGERAPRRARRPGGDRPGAHPCARLHEGPSRDRGEQPPDPARQRRRHPQRRDRERRRAPRALRDRARRAANDGRLRGDLRAHGASPTRPACARRDARRHGGGLARRARRPDALPRARTAAPALARSHGRRPLLRVDASRAHDRRRSSEDARRREPRSARDGSCTSSAAGS